MRSAAPVQVERVPQPGALLVHELTGTGFAPDANLHVSERVHLVAAVFQPDPADHDVGEAHSGTRVGQLGADAVEDLLLDHRDLTGRPEVGVAHRRAECLAVRGGTGRVVLGC